MELNNIPMNTPLNHIQKNIIPLHLKSNTRKTRYPRPKSLENAVTRHPQKVNIIYK